MGIARGDYNVSLYPNKIFLGVLQLHRSAITRNARLNLCTGGNASINHAFFFSFFLKTFVIYQSLALLCPFRKKSPMCRDKRIAEDYDINTCVSISHFLSSLFPVLAPVSPSHSP